MKQWSNTRDILLFLGGMAGVFHETVLAAAERPTLLILFAAMMGLPAFLRQDEKGHAQGQVGVPPQQVQQQQPSTPSPPPQQTYQAPPPPENTGA